jgi:hypothetical protein
METIKTQNFTLILSGVEEPTEVIENALFESNCDDALLYFRDRIGYLEFDREAASLEDAILSAICDIQQSGIKAKPIRVEPSDMVTSAEISRRLDRSRESISQLITGKRGKGDFPVPIAGVTANTMLWSWAEVADWSFKNKKISDYSVVETAQVIRRFNEALELYHKSESLDKTLEIVRKLNNPQKTKTLA